MKVELIEYTGRTANLHTPARYAAELLIFCKNTRLEQSAANRALLRNLTEEQVDDELNVISKTIRTSWEFVDYTFQISDVTRAFTHQFVRTRTASFAQQSQRTVDMSDFDALVPQSVQQDEDGFLEWEDAIKTIEACYRNLIELDISAQDARGILPTNVLTNIIMKCNLRTLADMLGKRKSLRAQGEYADVARSMEQCVLAVHPWASKFISPERRSTPALDAILKRILGQKAPAELPELNDALKELDALKGTWG